jgi:HPt (histidine-containing phosphotransfer) domain-containing protein
MRKVDSLDPNYSKLERFVNLPDLLARVEDDRELMAELLSMFQEELPELKNALHVALEDGNLVEAVKAAHTLKGVLANLSITQGTSLAATIENAARAGDMQQAKAVQAAFDAETEALSAAVASCLEGR